MSLVAGTWGIALTTGSGLVAADYATAPPSADVEVPTTAFEQPVSGQVPEEQARLKPLAAVRKRQVTPAALKQSPLPSPALVAYKQAARIMADVEPTCRLSWELLAAIGRVESNHGQYAGSRVDTKGVASPEIIGIPLNGTNNTAAIRDTDGGAYDGDEIWDRAVGPMQFIPSTWKVVGMDGNGDGQKDPHNIHDAALASAVYLCASGADVSTKAGASKAVFSYNHSTSYVATVLAIADAYEKGGFNEMPGVQPQDTIAVPPSNPRGDQSGNNDGDQQGPDKSGNDGRVPELEDGPKQDKKDRDKSDKGGQQDKPDRDGSLENESDEPQVKPKGKSDDDVVDHGDVKQPDNPQLPKNPKDPKDPKPKPEPEPDAAELCATALTTAGLVPADHLDACLKAFADGGEQGIADYIEDVLAGQAEIAATEACREFGLDESSPVLEPCREAYLAALPDVEAARAAAKAVADEAAATQNPEQNGKQK